MTVNNPMIAELQREYEAIRQIPESERTPAQQAWFDLVTVKVKGWLQEALDDLTRKRDFRRYMKWAGIVDSEDK